MSNNLQDKFKNRIFTNDLKFKNNQNNQKKKKKNQKIKTHILIILKIKFIFYKLIKKVNISLNFL